MLKLKKLQILGFKSFCDRTELRFHGDGIAAIVGPNGCGKSNIADAICWVLGEQSAKTLRGSRMEDVIFAGTRDRQPLGMAEVSLTLIDPEIYEGGNVVEPEIEVIEEMPGDDWDEAALRAKGEREAGEYIEEVRPGQTAPVALENAATERTASGEELSAGGSEAQDLSLPQEDSGRVELPATADGLPQNAPPHVVLKIRRRKFNRVTFKKGEVVVTRRLFRSGDSEYLLNGKLCRLRDIQDIFMGTGLGPETYAIIEQGRIGQILSSKPTDRRAIIEEAAGITKFKTRKRLAEARLEEARLNLSRLNDIFDEVTRQMNSLKRQAAKAERYARLREEMRAKLRLMLASKWVVLESERATLQEQLAAMIQEIQARSEAVARLEGEQSDRRQRGYEIEEQARLVRERLAAITLEVDRAISRQRTNEERCAELAVRSETAARDMSQAASRLAELEGERELNRQIFTSVAAEVAAAQQEAAQCQEEARRAGASLAEVEQQQEQNRIAVMQVVSEASAIRNEVAQASERIVGYERESERLQREMGDARSQIDAFGGRRGQIAFEFESAAERVKSLNRHIENTRMGISENRREEAECKRRLDTLRAEYATALGKKASLEAVIAEHGYSTESVRRLFQSGAVDRGFAPAGVLADFLEVEDRYEHVVDDFLRDELNYIVVESWATADQGLQLLRTDVDGRATFLVHPEDSQAKFSFVVNESARQAPRRDSVIPLKNCVRVLNGFGKSLEVILPKLRDGYLAPSAEIARELALENPDAFFLADTGECFHNVTVTGGKQRSEGPLAMKRELREVLKQAAGLENALREQERMAGLVAREINELTSLLDRLEGERREAEQQAMSSGHMLQQVDAEVARSRQRLDICEQELRQVADAREEQGALISERQQALTAREQRRTELERQIAIAQESLAGLRGLRDAAAHKASQMMARVAGLEERQRGAGATLERVESLIREVAVRLEGLRAQSESAVAEKQQREEENVGLAAQLVGLEGERELAELQGAELETESAGIRARLAEIESEFKAARESLDRARDQRGEIAARAAKLESDSVHMSEASVNELGMMPAELLNDPALVVVSGEQLAAEDESHREMRTRLENMGPVNMMALEEYKETAERHAFLEAQRKDLFDSIENTQKTIKEIEQVSREKFEEAFGRINQNFEASFRKLFGGGSAFMRLTDEDNSIESGIDVIASPPGKKLQNVLLLSGGEKALTALALLVGIFQYQPSPFCILDEVDAPLDEANIGRFTELVREMSLNTQFVIITHSKKTMGIAPVLYGVTMQEPGVSKLVSVRFNPGEARQAMSA